MVPEQIKNQEVGVAELFSKHKLSHFLPRYTSQELFALNTNKRNVMSKMVSTQKFIKSQRPSTSNHLL